VRLLTLAPIPVLAGLLLLAPLPARAQSADSDRNFPGVLAPLYEFGRRGAEPGQVFHPAGLAVGKDDLLYIADAGNHRVQMLAMNGQPRGAFGSRGSGPGQFVLPAAIAVAADGAVYVADAAGRLQAFSAEGRFVRAWDGLRSPRGIAVTADRIYVSEADLHRIRVFPREGEGDTVLGGLGSDPGRFQSPAGVAVDEDGLLFVADSGNHRIQKLDAAGKPLAQWGAWGGQAGLLSYPSGLACVGGRVYVADSCNHRIQVFDRQGAFIKQWGAAPPQPGQGAGRLHYPEGLAVSPSGGLTIVSEPVEDRLQVFGNRDLAKTTRVNDLPWWDSLHARVHAVRLAPPPPGGKPQMAGVLATADVHAVFCFDVATNALGPIAAAGGYGRKLGELNGIGGIAVDPDRGRVWVGDTGNRRITLYDLPRNPARPDLFGNGIRAVSSAAFDRLVPVPTPGWSPDAALPGPMNRGADGRIYILDRANAAILVFSPALRFERLVPVAPTLRDFAVGADGSLLATDPVRLQILRYGADGREREAWPLKTARLPWGIATDGQGFVYIADTLADAVLKLDREGKPVKRWGKTGPRPDELSGPRSLAFYAPDRLVVEDYGNHRAQLCSTEGEFLGNYVAGGLATPIAIR